MNKFLLLLAFLAPCFAFSQTNVAPGQKATLYVTVGSGSTPFTYQWRKDGVNIQDATNDRWYIASMKATDAGSYTVLVKNANGETVSNAAVLVYQPLTTAPVIVSQPASRTALVGESTTFTVGVTGTPAPTYQWRKNGVNIPGATSATYTIPLVSTLDTANYSVVATNSAGSVTSADAALSVSTPIVSPGNATINVILGPKPTI